jgi:hypothetical protein
LCHQHGFHLACVLEVIVGFGSKNEATQRPILGARRARPSVGKVATIVVEVGGYCAGDDREDLLAILQ